MEGTLGDLPGTELLKDGDWIESKDQDPKGGVRIIQLADIGMSRFVDKSNRFISEGRATQMKCTFLRPGDILIARMPDPIGRACILPDIGRKSVTAVDVCIVRVDPDLVHNRWLMHLINSAFFKSQLLKYVTGTTRKRISRKNLMKIRFEIPEKDEQHTIADILDIPLNGSEEASELIGEYLTLYGALMQKYIGGN